jgi:hypothetical protein
MVRSSKIEIEKFNGKFFKFWKLNMEDLLVEKYQWITMDLGTAPTRIQQNIGKSWIGRKRNNLVVSLRFSIIECVRGSYNQGIME